MTIIPQDPFLFEGSIFDNLTVFLESDRFGLPDDVEQLRAHVKRALEELGLYHVLSERLLLNGSATAAAASASDRSVTVTGGLGDVLDLRVEELGRDLSIGQRALVCLVRALLKVRLGLAAGRAQLLCIDEATAAIDEHTERALHTALARCSQSARKSAVLTCVLIAHRVRTVLDLCDRVLVLREGRVTELGTPRELLCNPDSHFALLLAKYHSSLSHRS